MCLLRGYLWSKQWHCDFSLCYGHIHEALAPMNACCPIPHALRASRTFDTQANFRYLECRKKYIFRWDGRWASTTKLSTNKFTATFLMFYCVRRFMRKSLRRIRCRLREFYEYELFPTYRTSAINRSNVNAHIKANIKLCDVFVWAHVCNSLHTFPIFLFYPSLCFDSLFGIESDCCLRTQYRCKYRRQFQLQLDFKR